MAVIVIHGGAGAIARTQMAAQEEMRHLAALHDILLEGRRVLDGGGSALDAVSTAVVALEDHPFFNAGYGAVLTADGTHELDAAIMDGQTQMSGAVAGVTTVKNPVLAARAVLEKSPHVFFAGAGAERFARTMGLEMVEPGYFYTQERGAQLARVQAAGSVMLDHDGGAPLAQDSKLGTVGAVALDVHGNLAAATSTGGMTNKQMGRIGDSPVIGAGCYARNTACAVSATGTGEVFIRAVAAHEVAALMAYAGLSLAAACHRVIHETIPALGGEGGLIAVDHAGNVALPFNTQGMYRGFARSGEVPQIAIGGGDVRPLGEYGDNNA